MRAEDLDANMSKISEDKHLGIWRGPNVYSYFDTRIVRRISAAKRRGKKKDQEDLDPAMTTVR